MKKYSKSTQYPQMPTRAPFKVSSKGIYGVLNKTFKLQSNNVYTVCLDKLEGFVLVDQSGKVLRGK